MTDQLWDHEERLLSKKLIGKISNMKDYWNSVSDEDAIVQRKGRFATTEPFAGKEFLQKNIQSKKDRYVSLLEEKNRPSKDDETQRKLKWEKGSKNPTSFWKDVVEDKNKRNAEKSLEEKSFSALRNVTKLQDKQSFWNDVSEDKLWETRKEKFLATQPNNNIRPQKQKVDLMIEEWKDNIKLFSKSDERANDCKKLRENMRFQNTGIKVDKLAKQWEEVSDDPKPIPKILDEDDHPKTGFLVNLLLEDDFKESMLKKQQSWNQAVLNGKRKTLSEISPAVMSEMSDIELLCHAIHICGEDFLTEDYSFMKKISFQRLAQVFPRDDLAGALAEGSNFHVIAYDGEVEDFEADTCIVLKIPIEEIVEAFNEMKLRNPNLYKTPKEKTTKFQERDSDSESDSD